MLRRVGRSLASILCVNYDTTTAFSGDDIQKVLVWVYTVTVR